MRVLFWQAIKTNEIGDEIDEHCNKVPIASVTPRGLCLGPGERGFSSEPIGWNNNELTDGTWIKLKYKITFQGNSMFTLYV